MYDVNYLHFPYLPGHTFPLSPSLHQLANPARATTLLHLRWNSVKLSTLKTVLEVCCFYI